MADTFRVVLRDVNHFDTFATREFQLPMSSSFPIGRASKNASKKGLTPAADNAFIDSPVISREHATLSANATTGSPRVYITDRGSMHGTLLNGRKLEHNTPEPLSTGDMLQFGIDVNRNEEYYVARKYAFEAHLPRSFSQGFSVPDAESEEEDVDTQGLKGSQQNPLMIDDSDVEPEPAPVPAPAPAPSEREKQQVIIIEDGIVEAAEPELPSESDTPVRSFTPVGPAPHMLWLSTFDKAPSSEGYSSADEDEPYSSDDEVDDDHSLVHEVMDRFDRLEEEDDEDMPGYPHSEASSIDSRESSNDSEREVPDSEDEAPAMDPLLKLAEILEAPVHPFMPTPHPKQPLFNLSMEEAVEAQAPEPQFPLFAPLQPKAFPPPSRTPPLPPNPVQWIAPNMTPIVPNESTMCLHGENCNACTLLMPSPEPTITRPSDLYPCQSRNISDALYIDSLVSNFSREPRVLFSPPTSDPDNQTISPPQPGRRTRVSIEEIVEDQSSGPILSNDLKRKADVLDEEQHTAPVDEPLPAEEANNTASSAAVAEIARRPKKQPRSIIRRALSKATYPLLGAAGAVVSFTLLSTLPDDFFGA